MAPLSRRWAWIVLPMLGVIALEALQDSVLYEALPAPVHVAILGVVLVGGAVIVAEAVFRRFDRLTAELKRQNDELEARSAAMAALQRMSLAVAALRDLDRVLETVTEQGRRLLGGDVAIVCLSAEDGRLSPRARSGPSEAFHPGPDSCPHPAGGSVVCPLLSLDGDRLTSAPGASALCRFVDPAYLGSAVAVPLRVGERGLGMLAVTAKVSREFGALELDTLGTLASQAAVAIENARLDRQVRELGMVEERNRIARELHDGLTQVLAYVSAKSEAAVSLLDAGRTLEARARVAELGEAARGVYVDVREAILGLSVTIDPTAGIVSAIREYVGRYVEAAKLPVEIVASPEAEATRLAPAAETQLLGLLQEVLTNVRKHAAARRVVVEARRADARFILEVRDDGVGFDPAAVASGDWPHYGMRAMHERAAAVSGDIRIDSRPGVGTTVHVSVPTPLDG